MTHTNAPLGFEGRRRLVKRCRTRPISHVATEMGAQSLFRFDGFPTNVPYAVVSYAMQTGNVGGTSMGWGVLSASASTFGPGATGQVWMDVTNDNKQSWIQCGPFYLSSAGGRITTTAYPTSNSASRAFRVCATLSIPVRDTGITCTPGGSPSAGTPHVSEQTTGAWEQELSASLLSLDSDAVRLPISGLGWSNGGLIG